MICPLMSRPVKAGDSAVLFRVDCREADCPIWTKVFDFDAKDGVGYACGLSVFFQKYGDDTFKETHA